jgi:signal transduction histidine kinase
MRMHHLVGHKDSAAMVCVVLHMVVLGVVIGLRLLPGHGEDVRAVGDFAGPEMAMALLSGSLLCLLVLFDRSSQPNALPQAQRYAHSRTAALNAAAPAAGETMADVQSTSIRASESWSDCAKLMARISHDLRTPLNAVIGFADMMQRELLGPIGHPRYREYVDHIRDSGAGLLKSAEDIMALTTVAAGTSQSNPVPIALGPLIREACRAVAAIADTKRLRVHVSGVDNRTLWGDRQALQVVIANLIAVAVERAPQAAMIVVRMAGTLAQPRLEIAVSPQTSEVTPAPIVEEIPDLSVAVASCLLRLQGGRLVTTTTADGSWSVRIILPGGGAATHVGLQRAA